MKKIGKIGLLAVLIWGLWLGAGMETEAEELAGTFTKEGGSHLSKLSDDDYNTTEKLTSKEVLSVSAKEGESISGLYILWDSPVKEWILETAEGEETWGKSGFLHEYVPLSTPQTQVKIRIPQGTMRISEIKVLGEGELPSWVQVWQPPCEKADIMLIPSHADDEILFFGGIMPTYHTGQGAAVQVVYMTEFWTTTPIREHEKLDGLWASGLDIYPVCGNFKDVYSKTLEKAKTQYSEEEMVDYLTEQIRRFKPQVVVTHDFKGEYGHGFHMLTCEATVQAVEAAALQERQPSSAETYGVWDVPKTYIHLYKENAIRLDLRIPMEEFGGMTALEVATEAYKKHVSQQWCWFYVSDDYEYSCADFGLYRTTVGTDTNNSMLDNIITYAEQERIAAEKAEAERMAAQEEARRQAEEEAKRLEEEKRLAEEKAAAKKAEEERLAAEEAARLLAQEEALLKAERNRKMILALCVLAGVLFTVIIIFFLRLRLKRIRNRKRRKGHK
ncbi:MAG: PIG-L family deacetylase [Lachnospiraceae bacterium]|nr:PIG-L family deacetylase [Lachnospiraceae bacterium]